MRLCKNGKFTNDPVNFVYSDILKRELKEHNIKEIDYSGFAVDNNGRVLLIKYSGEFITLGNEWSVSRYEKD